MVGDLSDQPLVRLVGPFSLRHSSKYDNSCGEADWFSFTYFSPKYDNLGIGLSHDQPSGRLIGSHFAWELIPLLEMCPEAVVGLAGSSKRFDSTRRSLFGARRIPHLWDGSRVSKGFQTNR